MAEFSQSGRWWQVLRIAHMTHVRAAWNICHHLPPTSDSGGRVKQKRGRAYRPVWLPRFYLVPNIAEEMAENRH